MLPINKDSHYRRPDKQTQVIVTISPSAWCCAEHLFPTASVVFLLIHQALQHINHWSSQHLVDLKNGLRQYSTTTALGFTPHGQRQHNPITSQYPCSFHFRLLHHLQVLVRTARLRRHLGGFRVLLGLWIGDICLIHVGPCLCLVWNLFHELYLHRLWRRYLDHIMAWIVEQQVSKHSRSLTAKTDRENAWDTQDGDFGHEEPDQNTLLNFSNWDAKVPPRFQPYFGRHRFFHRGRYFVFSREAKQMMYSSIRGDSVFQTDETIKLTCIGCSAQPIKDLVRECRDRYIGKVKACTVVRRLTRPSRPMETVVLEHDQKARVLADINEYLHPSTPTWYARRGIPYRRGYLFEGVPGTGKSSLAWAIAEVFGLNIYCISLVEPTLTEEDLELLFTNLPRRCVVLLAEHEQFLKFTDSPCLLFANANTYPRGHW